MEPKAGAGGSFNVKIGGSVHEGGQIGIGRRISQSYVRSGKQSSVAVTEADLAELERAIQNVKVQILAEAPGRQQSPALERVDEMKEAIIAEQPDLTTLQYVRKWFAKNLPKLTGIITGVIVHPVVGKIVEAAGELAAKQFRDQFDSASAD